MAKNYDRTTRRFVREATIGMVVIAGLLALIVVGIAKRFGAWDKRPPSQDIQSAVVFKRMHGSSASEENDEAIDSGPEERLATRPGETREVLNNESTQMPTPTVPPARPFPGSVTPPSNPRNDLDPSARVDAGPTRPGPTISVTETGSDPAGSPPELRQGSGFPGGGAFGPRTPNASDETVPVSPAGSSSRAQPFLPGASTEPGEAPIPSPFRDTPAAPVSTSDREKPKPTDGEPSDPSWLIRVDDTLWTFCQRNYGDPQWFRAFHAWLAKEGLVFESLQPGRQLKPPTKKQLRLIFPNLVPDDRPPAQVDVPSHEDKEAYTTSGSESLFDIAARKLGQAARYVELVELNKSSLPEGTDYLAPLPAGIRLKLPPRK